MTVCTVCNYCHENPKVPGSGQRFCSEACRTAARSERKRPSKKEVRLRAERRRRARGAKARPKTWNEQGQRFCPRCHGYVDLDCFKDGYCKPCLTLRRRECTLKKYGLTLENYDGMVSEQQGRCAICLTETTQLHVDHCHSEGHVRGLLCRKCNYQLLGLVNDNADLLRRAADYLDRF